MHNFWTISDPLEHQVQMAMFMKNISMQGGSLLITVQAGSALTLHYNQEKSSLTQQPL